MTFTEVGQNRVRQGRSERRGEAYDSKYVEPRSEMRTQPDAIFTNLLKGVLRPRPRLSAYAPASRSE